MKIDFVSKMTLATCISDPLAMEYNVKECIKLGRAYHNDGDFEKSIFYFSEAIQLELEPNNAELYFYRSNAYGNKNDYDQAIMDYDQV
ncbi:MAG: tetratricopeptide repeat protein [Spirochaetes bacterium]|nr:tetratricopeptide repeat protein [Brevinematales bacterium]MCL1959495.1 tetratricopeptide repeat protein [Spirochaetota bacterium]